MDKLVQLQQRKAELKNQIEQQSGELKVLLSEVREELKPATLLKNAVSGVFKSPKSEPGEARQGVFQQLPTVFSILADLLIKDPKLTLAFKLLAPMALRLASKIKSTRQPVQGGLETQVPKKPLKPRLYGRLRRTISSFRKRLKKTEEASLVEPEITKIIEN